MRSLLNLRTKMHLPRCQLCQPQRPRTRHPAMRPMISLPQTCQQEQAQHLRIPKSGLWKQTDKWSQNSRPQDRRISTRLHKHRNHLRAQVHKCRYKRLHL